MIRGAPASAAGPKQRAIKNITQPLIKLKKKAAEVVVSATGLFGDDDEL